MLAVFCSFAAFRHLALHAVSDFSVLFGLWLVFRFFTASKPGARQSAGGVGSACLTVDAAWYSVCDLARNKSGQQIRKRGKFEVAGAVLRGTSPRAWIMPCPRRNGRRRTRPGTTGRDERATINRSRKATVAYPTIKRLLIHMLHDMKFQTRLQSLELM